MTCFSDAPKSVTAWSTLAARRSGVVTAPAVERLQRTAFSTSRLLDFVSEKELTLQCGYGPHDWPLVVVKELIDNALDAREEQGVAPEIKVAVSENSITVADNGSGHPAGRGRSAARLLRSRLEQFGYRSI